jgi:hypothetical protein
MGLLAAKPACGKNLLWRERHELAPNIYRKNLTFVDAVSE